MNGQEFIEKNRKNAFCKNRVSKLIAACKIVFECDPVNVRITYNRDYRWNTRKNRDGNERLAVKFGQSNGRGSGCFVNYCVWAYPA